MTRGQWHQVMRWLSYGVDWNAARLAWWTMCCDDKELGVETAAKYEEAMRLAESLRKIIEDTLWPPAEQTEEVTP